MQLQAAHAAIDFSRSNDEATLKYDLISKSVLGFLWQSPSFNGRLRIISKLDLVCLSAIVILAQPQLLLSAQ